MHNVSSCHTPGHLRDQFIELAEAVVEGGPLPKFSHYEQDISAKRLCGLLWFSGDIIPSGYPLDDIPEAMEAMGLKPPKLRTYGAYARSVVRALSV